LQERVNDEGFTVAMRIWAFWDRCFLISGNEACRLHFPVAPESKKRPRHCICRPLAASIFSTEQPTACQRYPVKIYIRASKPAGRMEWSHLASVHRQLAVDPC
jgi:hypothetical protein